MKTLKNTLKYGMILCIALFASYKKDKSDDPENSLGTITYQNKNMNITSADYRSGNGDGTWLYLMTNNFNTLQIRFGGLADYAIPIGTSAT